MLPTHITRSPRSGIYYFRFVVPVNLRRHFGLVEIRRSLRTTDLRQAKILAFQQFIEIASLIETIKRPAGMTDDDINELIRQGLLPANGLAGLAGTSKWEFEVTPRHGFRMHTEPGNLQDSEAATQAINNILESNPKLVPVAPLPATLGATPGTKRLKSTQGLLAYEKFLEEFINVHKEKWTAKTEADYKSKLTIFGRFLGSRSLHTVRNDDMTEFLHQRSKVGSSIVTRDNYVTPLSQFFEYAKSANRYPSDIELPTSGQTKLSKADKKRLKATGRGGWLAFDDDDLVLLFNPITYLERLTKPHEFWCPLLGLFTGARIEEISQSSVDDFCLVKGVLCFQVKFDCAEKGVKNASAIRDIPLHQTLIDLGFMDYLADVAKDYGKKSRIFPYLRIDEVNGFSDVPSESFKRYRESVGVMHPKKVFHSFRSNVADRLRQQDAHREVRDQILGHADDSIDAQHYSYKLAIGPLGALISSKLNFPAITNYLPQLHYPRHTLMQSLPDEMGRRQRHIEHAALRAKLGGKKKLK
jgi:hypothetical protein